MVLLQRLDSCERVKIMWDEPAMLIAEGHWGDQVRLESLLQNQGRFTVVAQDQVDLIAKVARARPGVIFLDADFCATPLEEFINVIKRLNPSVPIVVTVKDNNPQLEERVRKAGIFYYILKPVEADKVWAVVQAALKTQRQSRLRIP